MPSQERSRRRFEAILDAASDLFASQGFEATTMDAIATRANTSIGSLYQFFPNKLEVFRSMADRCMARSEEVFANVIQSATVGAQWDDFLDVAVDQFAQMHRDDASFRALVMNAALYGEFEAEDTAMLQRFVEASALLLGTWAPELDAQRRALVAGVIVNCIATMLVIASREEASFEGLLEETKRMIKCYVGSYVSPGSGAPA